MPLASGQIQVRDLVMGPGTPYTILDSFNPFNRQARAEQSQPRAWNHGATSGAEWAAEVVVDIPIRVRDPNNRTPPGWLASHDQLAAAFAPIGDSTQDVELRFNYCGREYVMFGRPRMLEPATATVRRGWSRTQAAFVALDPRRYSGALHTAATTLPMQTGGLIVPLTVPFTVDGVLTGGREDALNEGTADTGLVLRIDGPVINPRLAVQRPDGEVQSIRFDLTLSDGQWLDVDTAARSALLNGLPEANQRGRAVWDVDPYPLPPGTSVLRFQAGDFNVTAQLSAFWRDAWW